jgi:hypothetical protein
VAYLRPRFRRRRQAGVDSAAPRPLGCLWPIFWLILIIVLLGLLFGGYRKGTKVGAPAPAYQSSSLSASVPSSCSVCSDSWSRIQSTAIRH